MLNEKEKGWIYVAIQMLIILLILFLSVLYHGNSWIKSGIISILGLLLAAIGFMFIFATILSFKQIMTPNPVPLRNSNLRKTGLYKYIRHPMYSSVLLFLFGIVVYFKSIFGFMAWVAAVIFIMYKIRFEEQSLRKHFPEYDDYCNTTKKLIPFVY